MVIQLHRKTPTEQRQSKNNWNLQHQNSITPNFFTIGYSGLDIHSFIELLKKAGVTTLVDIRWTPISRFKPDFSKNNLKNALEKEKIIYIHRGDWGIPRYIRNTSNVHNGLWIWYDTNVLPNITREIIEGYQFPIAFMCMEFDPMDCHRHRLFLGLEKLGFAGREL
jgi:uncharacterized protein (DUF488 family)